jgi:hypothetical protein
MNPDLFLRMTNAGSGIGGEKKTTPQCTQLKVPFFAHDFWRYWTQLQKQVAFRNGDDQRRKIHSNFD